MSILESLPATIASAMSSIFRDATLHRITGRVSDDRGGFTNTATDDACKALVEDYSQWMTAPGGGGIPAGERKILILAATLSAAPKPTDTITIQGRTWSIVEVKSDPANATYECRGK